ncbi:AraC family transcriptional regulator [Bacillus sp. SJS]|uniref:AraC family transcriptional regulator n=1 Tax=Bacillus sp. SJS TaxID=1423321 RepID=UPI00068BB44D|nr:AraC family transcriptional regulator [Bacillus sp. SJS]KZZ84500.1 AraC family transcriptional regulator [Bacillus sp. SJS]
MLKEMNEALRYIEEHLGEELDMREAARIARCSEFHFKKMFSYLAGMTLLEYIRRRRLTLAGFELKKGDVKVIDTALKYGYQSPDAFARAFQQLHGITPSEAKTSGHSLKAYPPVSFQLSIQGGKPMNYRIVEKDAFRIVGIKKRVQIVFEGVNPEIAAMWNSLNPQLIQELKALSDVEPPGLISASANFSEGRLEEKGALDHYIGVATVKDGPAHFASLEVKPSLWAVFEAIGPFPDTLQNVWGRVYSEWFPSSGYEQTEGPEILWNESKDTSSPVFRSEIWFPVKARDEIAPTKL